MTTTHHHALYRFYSATGQLLYVGITNNPGNRFTQHQQDKPWWHDVAGISVERFDTREEALAAETRAIAVEHPLYNVKRPSLPSQRRRRAATTETPRQSGLVWMCDTCRKPIADGTGYIHVNMATVGQRQRAWRKFDEEHSTGGALVIQGATWDEFFDLPDLAPWQAHHEACDPLPDAGDYFFGVDRARSHAQLLNWTSHLMEKAWLEYTDWADLIGRMAGVDA